MKISRKEDESSRDYIKRLEEKLKDITTIIEGCQEKTEPEPEKKVFAYVDQPVIALASNKAEYKRHLHRLGSAYSGGEHSYNQSIGATKKWFNLTPDPAAPSLINWIENTGVRPDVKIGAGDSLLALDMNGKILSADNIHDFYWSLDYDVAGSVIICYAIIKPPVMVE